MIELTGLRMEECGCVFDAKGVVQACREHSKPVAVFL
jgi:hypothetical protein